MSSMSPTSMALFFKYQWSYLDFRFCYLWCHVLWKLESHVPEILSVRILTKSEPAIQSFQIKLIPCINDHGFHLLSFCLFNKYLSITTPPCVSGIVMGDGDIIRIVSPRDTWQLIPPTTASLCSHLPPFDIGCKYIHTFHRSSSFTSSCTNSPSRRISLSPTSIH